MIDGASPNGDPWGGEGTWGEGVGGDGEGEGHSMTRQPEPLQPPVEYSLVVALLRQPLRHLFQFNFLLPLRNTVRIDPSCNNKE